MEQTLQDLMTRNFVTVQDVNELSQPVSPNQYVVIVDAEGTPAALTIGEDIALGFSPENLFLAGENISVNLFRQLRPVLESNDFSPHGIGVMRGQNLVGIIPFDKFQVDKVLEKAQTPVSVHYRCRRSPRCLCEKAVALMDTPPLCEISAAHGHMILVETSSG